MKIPSPFKIQPMESLGSVLSTGGDLDFEHAVGDDARGIGEASFLGASITKKRLQVGGVIALCVFGLFVARAAHLQIIKGNSYFNLAEGNRISSERIIADRGLITDRTGELLVKNVPAFSLWVSSDDLADDEKYVGLIEKVARLLGVTDNEVHDILVDAESELNELLVSQDVAYESAMMVMASQEEYDGIRISAGNRREYDTRDNLTLSSLLGYVGIINKEEYAVKSEQGYGRQDIVGKAGIESSYEELLMGFHGERSVEVDAIGKEQSILRQREAVDGANLTLHIDSELQKYIEDKLNELSARTGIINASVIVMDPRDGGIRALVSYPGFDSNIFTGVIDADEYRSLIENPASPLFTRAVSGHFPSGSTFKPIVAAAALDEGVIDRNTSIVSTGGIRIGQFFFPDWKAGGHGVTNVTKAIAESVNSFFYIIGGGYKEFDGLGLSKMMGAASKYGLGSKLGIDLPGEKPGFLPSVEWKNEVKDEPWYIGDTYHVAIGQGDILVTPLQVAAFTATFANGGKLYRPQIVDGYESQGQYHDVTPVVLNDQVATPDAIEIVREGLRSAVTTGSARRLLSLPVTSAGKTGTAQWSSTKPNHAWFTGFAPYENPELVATVLIQEGGEGSEVAVPLTYDIFSWWFTRNNDSN